MDCHTTQINEGLNGFNNYTYTTATFVMPAINNATPVTINVSNVRPSTGIWAAAGSYLFINGNYLLVVSSTENTITVTNPQTSILYTTNQAPGSVIPSNSLVITTGPQGPPVTFPRRSVMCDTSGFSFNNPITSGYQTLFTGNLVNYLTSANDCIEMEYSVRFLGGEGAGVKLILGGITIHELTDLSGTDGFRNVYHKIKLVRGSNNTSYSYISELVYDDSTGTGITDIRPLNSRQLKLISSTTSAASVSNLSVVCQVDVGAAILGASTGFFAIKFTPYDN